MTGTQIAPGCKFHWEGFVFADGETANKFLVIVGAKSGCNILAVIATSKPHKRDYVPGCNSERGYFHIPGGRDGFKLDTWLLIAEPREITPAEFAKRALEGKITLKETLRENIANAIRNCMKRCPDVSADHIALL